MPSTGKSRNRHPLSHRPETSLGSLVEPGLRGSKTRKPQPWLIIDVKSRLHSLIGFECNGLIATVDFRLAVAREESC
jgi:hypothetical protein